MLKTSALLPYISYTGSYPEFLEKVWAAFDKGRARMVTSEETKDFL